MDSIAILGWHRSMQNSGHLWLGHEAPVLVAGRWFSRVFTWSNTWVKTVMDIVCGFYVDLCRLMRIDTDGYEYHRRLKAMVYVLLVWVVEHQTF